MADEPHLKEEVQAVLEVHDFTDEAEDTTPGPRTRSMTERGRDYASERKKHRLEQLARGLEKSIVRVQGVMEDGSEDKDVQAAYRGWIALYDEFLEVDQEYKELMTEDEREIYITDWFEDRNSTFRMFKETMEQWCTTHAQKQKAKLKVTDEEISVISSRRSGLS